MSGKDDVFQAYISSAFISGSAMHAMHTEDSGANQGQAAHCSVHKMDENSSDNANMAMSSEAIAISEQANPDSMENVGGGGAPAAVYTSSVPLEPNQISCPGQFHEPSGGIHPDEPGRHLSHTAGAVHHHADPHPHHDQQAPDSVPPDAPHIPHAAGNNGAGEAHADAHGFDRLAGAMAARGADMAGLPDGILLACGLEPHMEAKLIGVGDVGVAGGGFGAELVALLNQLEVHVRGPPGRDDEIRTGILQVI